MNKIYALIFCMLYMTQSYASQNASVLDPDKIVASLAQYQAHLPVPQQPAQQHLPQQGPLRITIVLDHEQAPTVVVPNFDPEADDRLHRQRQDAAADATHTRSGRFGCCLAGLLIASTLGSYVIVHEIKYHTAW